MIIDIEGSEYDILSDITKNSKKIVSLIKIFVISCILPSATCITDIPSIAFLLATAIDRIVPRMFSEMASPAASSLALLIRNPVDNFCMLSSSFRVVVSSDRSALTAARFVLILKAIRSLPYLTL